MPKVPKDTESTTPKKRTRKATTETDDGTKVVKAVKAAAKPAKAAEVVASAGVVVTPSMEEQIRIRAYELYLRREGRGGSPEQDWFEAAAEVYGESVA